MSLSSHKVEGFPIPRQPSLSPNYSQTPQYTQPGASQTLSLGLANSHDPSLNLGRQSSTVGPRQ